MTGSTCICLTVAVPIRELKLFRKIIRREQKVLVDSFSVPRTGKLADSTPHVIVREYLEMSKALEKLDEYLAGAGVK